LTESEHTSDAEQVARTLAGDHGAYKELVTRYQGHVYGLAYSLSGNWTDAQDIAQEAFIRAYTNLDQLRDPGRFAAWLRRVAFGAAMDWLRAFRPKLFEQLDGQADLDKLEIPDFRPGPPEVAQRRELAEAVLAAVAGLPPKYRLPLTMFHLDGLSYQKVADFLDIPVGTAKSMIHRAQKKLKAILAATAKEMIPVVQEVFNEHKLPEKFAEKVLENVPTLAWGKGKECTFAGALEAAMAVTEHPYKYSDIMGFTGLAFRVRWFKGPDGQGICPSCAVGEMEEEIAAAERATGWPLKIEVHCDDRQRIVESINAGRPVPAYDGTEDMAVVYGYSEGGRKFLVRDYHKGDQAQELDAGKIGWLWLILGERKAGLSRREAVIEGLRIAVHNWRREVGREGPGDYWYGPAAYRAWSGHLARYDSLPNDKRKLLGHVNWWNMFTLIDARRSAVASLDENAGLLDGQIRKGMLEASSIYKQASAFLESEVLAKGGCFLLFARGKSLADWTPDIRHRETELLTEAERYDAPAIAELDKALAAERKR